MRSSLYHCCCGLPCHLLLWLQFFPCLLSVRLFSWHCCASYLSLVSPAALRSWSLLLSCSEFVADAFPKRGCVLPRIIVTVVFPVACCSGFNSPHAFCHLPPYHICSLFFKGGMRALNKEEERQVARAVGWVRDLPLLRVDSPVLLLP